MSVAENLKSIHEKIKSAGRGADDVTLVAVSKKQPLEKIKEALAAGHRVFGENRVQEAMERWSELKETIPPSLALPPIHGGEGWVGGIELHLIGPLQTNKVKDAVALFDIIQSVDREKLARALSDEMKKQNKKNPCFIQVNTGGEEQKSGIAPEALPAFLKFCQGECGLDVRGVMCIPPVDEPPALHFALLKKLADENGLKELSMGMSGDFEKALALGATHIRVGTALFGEREERT